MPRDEARVRRCSKKASAKRSMIKCVRHPGQKRRATNQSHNSRARAAVMLCAPQKTLFGAIQPLRAIKRLIWRDSLLATCKAAARSRFTRFYVASLIPLPARPAQSLLAAASGGRMLPARENFRSSELAPVMTTTLSLIPGMKFCVLSSARSQLSTINTELLRNDYRASNSSFQADCNEARRPPPVTEC